VTEQASNISAGRSISAGGAIGSAAVSFEDAALVQRSQRGDMQAYGLLIAKYQDRVFNVISRMCSGRHDAEDLTQETFLRALERIGQFRGKSRFYTWLFRVAVNLTISHGRRAGRVRFRSLSAGHEGAGTQAEGLTARLAEQRVPAPDAQAVAAETQRRVAAAVDALDEEFRLVVLLRDVEEMDYAQIGDVLAVPVGTVKSRLHRARCTLREALSDLVS